MPIRASNSRPFIAGSLMLVIIALVVVAVHAAMSGSEKSSGTNASSESINQELVIYIGRSESLVGPIIESFQRETGIRVRTKYASTGPLAALILEEGRRSPADVFYAQDPGGLAVLADRGRLRELPEPILDLVHSADRDHAGRWVGITGRIRTLSYSTERVASADLPDSVLELTEERWRGRVGWAPSNASFQAFITAMRHELGETETERWLRDMIANEVRTYPRNMPIVQAVADGEIDLGLVNHYYLHRFIVERGESFPVANHIPAGTNGTGDLGGTMLISGAGILETARNSDAAERFLQYLLSEEVQHRFVSESSEYPLRKEMAAGHNLPSDALRSVDLNRLGDLEQTIGLLRRVGALR
ncbi:MAG: iron ABC transporter substrate-binding protein [Phycisphaerales bacterium]|nr:MAG: iron ABC transporter substrate-binding protein [Phycisphaerales bacterium]